MTESSIGEPHPAPWTRAWEQIDKDFDEHLEEIRNFLRCPTVSASDDDMLAGAEYVAALIEDAGGSAEIIPTAGHPAVLGRIEGDGPRLLRYGMYDVQPADEPGWSSPPFAAATADLPGAGSSIVARGAANSKGSLASFLLALASARRVSDLPAEIVFLMDGEEELGSPSLPGVMSDRRTDLAAEAAFDMDLTADRRDVAEVYLGCKGIVSFVLSCSGGEWGGPVGRALHSSEGVVISSPAWSLVRALSALRDAAERDSLDGLLPAAVPPEDERLLDALARDFDPAAHLEESGALAYRGLDDARSLLTALMYEPGTQPQRVLGWQHHGEDDRAARGHGRARCTDSLRDGCRGGVGRDRAHRRAGGSRGTCGGGATLPAVQDNRGLRRWRAPWSSPSATWDRRRWCGLRRPGGRPSTSSSRCSGSPSLRAARGTRAARTPPTNTPPSTA